MHKKIVIYSRGDLAGENIAKELKEKNINAKEIKTNILYLQKTELKADLLIVASKHKSASEIPVLTTHSPGNYWKADYGGNPRELGIAPADYLRCGLEYLREKKGEYETSYEATHHGPTSLKIPIMYVEVGSSPREWDDFDACGAVAESIKKLTLYEPEKKTPAIGIGGGHYCRKFSRIKDYSLGHICPKHNLENLDEKMVCEMIQKTHPIAQIILVEKKGLGKEKERIYGLLEKTGLEIKKI